MRDGADVDRRFAALEARIAALEARLSPQRCDISGLLAVLREQFPGGVNFLAGEVLAAAQLDTSRGIALKAELAAAHIRSARQLGKLLRRAGVERIGTARGASLWKV